MNNAQLTRCRAQWRDFVNTFMNLRIYFNRGILYEMSKYVIIKEYFEGRS